MTTLAAVRVMPTPAAPLVPIDAPHPVFPLEAIDGFLALARGIAPSERYTADTLGRQGGHQLVDGIDVLAKHQHLVVLVQIANPLQEVVDLRGIRGTAAAP